MHHAFSHGKLVRTTKRGVTIRLAHHGTTVLALFGSGSGRAVALRKNTAVICSWIRETPEQHTPDELDVAGVEPFNRWYRPDTYVPRHEHDTSKPAIEAEHWFRDRLRAAGIRAEHATLYEDENLGIDLWVHIFLTGTWRWIPLDVTLRSVENDVRDPECKFYIGQLCGVIPVQLTAELNGMTDIEITHFLLTEVKARLKAFAGIPLMHRKVAMELEKEHAKKHRIRS
jgi:hypothetical protein